MREKLGRRRSDFGEQPAQNRIDFVCLVLTDKMNSILI